VRAPAGHGEGQQGVAPRGRLRGDGHRELLRRETAHSTGGQGKASATFRLTCPCRLRQVFVEELEGLRERTPEALEGSFNEEGGTSPFLVWYMRLLTAGHLKRNPEVFAPFIDDGCQDVAAFCQR
jgi:hypothetical protein